MTQSDLNRAVARATGETVRTIAEPGIQLRRPRNWHLCPPSLPHRRRRWNGGWARSPAHGAPTKKENLTLLLITRRLAGRLRIVLRKALNLSTHGPAPPVELDGGPDGLTGSRPHPGRRRRVSPGRRATGRTLCRAFPDALGRGGSQGRARGDPRSRRPSAGLLAGRQRAPGGAARRPGAPRRGLAARAREPRRKRARAAQGPRRRLPDCRSPVHAVRPRLRPTACRWGEGRRHGRAPAPRAGGLRVPLGWRHPRAGRQNLRLTPPAAGRAGAAWARPRIGSSSASGRGRSGAGSTRSAAFPLSRTTSSGRKRPPPASSSPKRTGGSSSRTCPVCRRTTP